MKRPLGSDATRLLLAVSASAAAATVAFNLAGMNDLTGLGVTLGLASLAMAALSSPRFQSLVFALWVLAFAACALFYPEAFISWGGFELKQAIIPLVQLIMFGMGTTLAFGDFARVIRIPKAVLIGFGLQYTVMPLMGWTYATLFGLEGELAAGLILYGSCAGGVTSNVVTYIAGANLALSVTMTAFSTMMSPLMTPLADEGASRTVSADQDGADDDFDCENDPCSRASRPTGQPLFAPLRHMGLSLAPWCFHVGNLHGHRDYDRALP